VHLLFSSPLSPRIWALTIKSILPTAYAAGMCSILLHITEQVGFVEDRRSWCREDSANIFLQTAKREPLFAESSPTPDARQEEEEHGVLVWLSGKH
jgi:hypothetical protein